MNVFETDTGTIVAILQQMLPIDRFKIGSLINRHWRKLVSAYFKIPLTWYNAARRIQRQWFRATNRNYTSVIRNKQLETYGIFTVVYHVQVRMPPGVDRFIMVDTPIIAMYHVCAETNLSQPLGIYIYGFHTMDLISPGIDIEFPYNMQMLCFEGILSRHIEYRKNKYSLNLRPYINAQRIDNNAITFRRADVSSALSVCVRFYGYTIHGLKSDPIIGTDFERWRLCHKDTLYDLQKNMNITKNDN
jgi:hypothetical protein